MHGSERMEMPLQNVLFMRQRNAIVLLMAKESANNKFKCIRVQLLSSLLWPVSQSLSDTNLYKF